MVADQIFPLVQSIVAWLSPFFPYLIKGAKLAGEEWFKALGEKSGEESIKKASDLWDKIKKKSSNDKNIEGAALILSEQPENTDIQKVLINALVEIVKKNSEFARELEIFKENSPAINMTVGNIFTGDPHIGGDVVGRDKTG